MLIILIPLGGIGKRFRDNGYNDPKCLIKALNKPILFWLLNCIIEFFKDESDLLIVIPYLYSLDDFNFVQRVKDHYKSLKFHFIRLHPTKGATDTVHQGLVSLSNMVDQDCPILCVDSDTFYKTDIFRKWDRRFDALYGFIDNGNIPHFSYILANESNEIKKIKEKQMISNIANVGIYAFNSWIKLKNLCQVVIESSKNSPAELYLSNVVSECLKSESKVLLYQIEESDFVCLGTPSQLEVFISSNPSANHEKYRFCFDLDGTLVTSPKVHGDYSTVDSIESNVRMVRYLYDNGHRIIIHTARRMKTHGGNLGSVIADIGSTTLQTLKQFNIPYHEIYFGKPYADVYIDDCAISTNGLLTKQLGYHIPNHSSRQHHRVEINGDIVKKSSLEIGSLKPQIQYYLNLTEPLLKYVPRLLDYDSEEWSWYSISRVYGSTLSELYLNQSFTEPLLIQLLETLLIFHQYHLELVESQSFIYCNYKDKVLKRYKQHQQFYQMNCPSNIDLDGLLIQLTEGLEKYESDKRAKCGIIIGDPVFSNVFLSNNQILFIDMRGEQGNMITIYGDIFYDYAKVLQSLVGYDSIMHNCYLSPEYQQRMIDCFKVWFLNHYSKRELDDLMVITSSLFFSLIPLHQDEPTSNISNYLRFANYLLIE